MVEILALLFIGAIVALFIRQQHHSPAKSSMPSQAAGNKKDKSQWVADRIAEALKLQESGAISDDCIYPDWYFDEPTDRQITKLKAIGYGDSVKQIKKMWGLPVLTKGIASDLIGMEYPASDEDLKILRFFKQPTKGLTQTMARHEVAVLFSQEGNLELWENRPATPMDREFYRYFHLKPSKNLTHSQAQEDRSNHFADNDSIDLENDWDNYVDMYAELTDREFRRDEEIKKVPISTYREAVDALRESGTAVSDLDCYEVLEKIQEIKPDIDK